MSGKLLSTRTLAFGAALLASLFLGLLVPIDFLRDQSGRMVDALLPAEHAEHHDAADPLDDHDLAAEEHVEISHTVQGELGIRIGRAKLGDYTSKIELPGFVRELPGADNLEVASRFDGLVTKVDISRNLGIPEGATICQIQLTGEQLARTQTALLAALTNRDIAQAELDRLQPIVDQGGAVGKKLVELRYELRRSEAEIANRIQELFVYGFDQAMVNSIQDTRELVQEFNIRVPADLLPPQTSIERAAIDQDAFHKTKRYTVDAILARTGQMVRAGDSVCNLAYHELLVVEGQAFEKDLPLLERILKNENTVELSLGDERTYREILQLKLAYLATHADPVTNTFPFYVYLPNTVAGNRLSIPTSQDVPAATSATRWKPGQRAHIRVPQDTFENKIILPRDALALDGIRTLVFLFKEDDHEHHPDEEHGDHEHFDIYEALDVQVLHMDRDTVVIEPKRGLTDAEIAISHANQILFAMQAASGEGGGHHHHH